MGLAARCDPGRVHPVAVLPAVPVLLPRGLGHLLPVPQAGDRKGKGLGEAQEKVREIRGYFRSQSPAVINA